MIIKNSFADKNKCYNFIIKGLMRLGIIALSFLNPVLLTNLYESLKEKIRIKAMKRHIDPDVILLLKRSQAVNIQYINFLRIDLGLEMFYQTAGQILLILLTYTDTPTTGGLNRLYEQTSLFGWSPETLIILLVLWSLRSGIVLHVKSIVADKIVFRFTPLLIVIFWGVFATARRMLTLVVFFIPSMGLLNLLNHWKAEQIQFRIRKDAFERGYMTTNDTLELVNMTETVPWTDIDRWTYTDTEPQPPSYSLYTGLSLTHIFAAFILLLFLHFISVYRVKRWTVEGFMRKNIFNDCVHILENLNIPFPHEDWDNKKGSVKEYREQLRKVDKEMMATFAVNSVISIVMFLPLWLTGKRGLGVLIHII